MCKSPAEKAKLSELSELSELELEGMFLFDKDVRESYRWHRDKMADANFQTFEGSSWENPWKPRRSRLP